MGNNVNKAPAAAAATNDFPSYVGLMQYGDNYCAGTVISPCHVVTSASCGDFRRNMYMLKRRRDSTTGDDFNSAAKVDTTFVHPYFDINDLNSEYDISVIRLSECTHDDSFTFPTIRDVKYHPSQNTKLKYYGFGHNGRTPNAKAQIMDVSYAARSICNNPYLPWTMKDQQFCTVVKDTSTSRCGDLEGDLGSGLFDTTNSDIGIDLVGMLSYATCNERRPSERMAYFLNLRLLRPWIYSTVCSDARESTTAICKCPSGQKMNNEWECV